MTRQTEKKAEKNRGMENRPAEWPIAINPNNPLLKTDSYKVSHWSMGQKDTEVVSAYIEARKPWDGLNKIVFFGLQAELMSIAGTVVTREMIDEAVPFLESHGLKAQAEGWNRIVDVHGGRLPVKIYALPEGTVVKPGVPQVRVENTDPALWWLPGYLETRLLRSVWYGSTVASLSSAMRAEIESRMMMTDGSVDGVDFKLHDFGARGASSGETAGLGGCAHMLSFKGSDTVEALIVARNAYGADMAGYSIPATEHSIVTAWGPDREGDFYEALLDRHPTGLIACVSDSWDLWKAVNELWGDRLREKILARDGTLVVRPDSGDPETIVPDIIEALMARFGEEKTPTGWRILPKQIRVIQGDGIDRFSTPRVMDAMMKRKLAIGNIAFGMGGGLLQQVSRDSFGYAFKVSAVRSDGVWRDVWKDPVTANGSKTSKKGRVAVVDGPNGPMATRLDAITDGDDLLRPVFENGKMLAVETLEDIRSRLRESRN